MRWGSLVSLVVASSALAQPSPDAPAAQWTRARLVLTVGAISRGITEFPVQSGGVVETPAQIDSAGGRVQLSPGPIFTSAALSGAWFLRAWLGLGAELRVDPVRFSFLANSNPDTAYATSGALLALLRWQPSGPLGLEAQVGWAAAERPIVFGLATPMTRNFVTTGPVGGLAVNLELSRHLWLQLYGRGEYATALQRVGATTDQASSAYDYGLVSGFGLTGGLQARIVSIAVGPVELGVGVLAELTGVALRGPLPPPGAVQTLVQGGPLRVGLGLAVQTRSEAPAAAPPTPPPVQRLVQGVVVRADRTPVAGARVTVGSASLETGADGAFEVRDPTPGPQVITARAAGLRPTTAQVVVGEGVTRAELVLEVPSGPGQLRGVVRGAPDTPLAGAKVTSGGRQTVSQADGTYTLEAVGPGPVSVQVTLPGYAAADESVMMLPEATATLDVMLEPIARGARAKLRGVISSAAGAVSKATVSVVQLKLKLKVQAGGRFDIDVPAGRYTIVIEAPTYVTQTKQLEVAPGEQAIFQLELEKAR